MKKLLWFGLVALPFALLLVSPRTRDLASQREEQAFRKDVLSEPLHTPVEPGSPPNPPLQLEVSVVENKAKAARAARLGTLNHAQVRSLLSHLHLQKATAGASNGGNLLEIAGSCGTITLSAKSARTRIEPWGKRWERKSANGMVPLLYVLPCSFDWGKKWSGYELTPSNARALKDQLLARYSGKIKKFESHTPHISTR